MAVIACFATVMVPEVRSFMGFPPEHQPAGPPPVAVEPTSDQSATASPDAAPAPVPVTTKPAVPCDHAEELTEDGIVFGRICSGTFIMGSAENAPHALDNEKPAHQVTLSEFWIGKTEITNEQFRRFRSNHQGEIGLPATNVSWFDAKAACEHFGGRLPTEAEWEYAARAGSQTVWSFGDDEKLLRKYAWYGEDIGGTPHPVGMKRPNAWGLGDMYGNVCEWVADWDGFYPAEVTSDPTGPLTGVFRVVRGGVFLFDSWLVRSATRFGYRPDFRDPAVGFRCARNSRHP